MKDSIFNNDDGFQPLIRNAKKKSLKKTILVSTLVTIGILLILFLSFIFCYYKMQNSMSDYHIIKMDQNKVFGANIYHDKSTFSYSIDSATNQDQYVKDIAGVPYTWYNEQTWFKIYDSATTIYDNSITSTDEHQYYRNGQRVVNFYIPGKEKIKDDRKFLQSLQSTNIVEIAISFKREISPSQVIKQFPSAQWAWVNSKEDISITPGIVIGDYAYGFTITHSKKGATHVAKDVEDFKRDLIKLSKEDEKDTNVKPILKSIRESGSVQISGVILTGKLKELLPIIRNDSVNYISVGVILPY